MTGVGSHREGEAARAICRLGLAAAGCAWASSSAWASATGSVPAGIQQADSGNIIFWLLAASGWLLAGLLTILGLRALRHADRRRRVCDHALEATQVGVWDRDLKTNRATLNARARDLMGRSWAHEEIDVARVFERVHPDYRETLEGASRKAVQESGHYDVEYMLKVENDEYRWFRSRAMVVTEKGKARRLVGSITDITAEKAAARALRERDEQARQAQRLEAVGRLAGGVAHDFNNLLTAIRGYTSLASSSLPEAHEAQASLRMVEEAANQATGVAGSLMTFARKADPLRAVIPLARPVESTLRLFQKMVPRAVEVRVDLSRAPGLLVEADEAQLQQALMNLCLNAKDAVGEHGIIQIAVQPEQREGSPCARISVKDDGEGMNADVRARAFEPYFTTRSTSTGGGMGLSVVHSIVREHEGWLEVESSPGNGSMFSVLLPLAQEPSHTSPTQAARGGAGSTALVLEHNEMIRAVLTSMLEALGYTVLAGATAQDVTERFGEPALRATALLVAKDPRRRPGWDDLARVLKPDAARVAVGGRDESVEDARGWGAVALRKPFQLADLRGAIEASRNERKGAVP